MKTSTMTFKNLTGTHYEVGCTYARFVHRGDVSALLSAYRYLWGVWFPRSDLELADREDFERYTERFRGPLDPRSEIEVYFPVR